MNTEQEQLLIDEPIDEENLLSISQRDMLEFEEHSDNQEEDAKEELI